MTALNLSNLGSFPQPIPYSNKKGKKRLEFMTNVITVHNVVSDLEIHILCCTFNSCTFNSCTFNSCTYNTIHSNESGTIQESEFTLSNGRSASRVFVTDAETRVLKPSLPFVKYNKIQRFDTFLIDNYVTHTFWSNFKFRGGCTFCSWSLALISKSRKVIGSQFMKARLPGKMT